MKFKIRDSEEFVPVKVSLTIESVEELAEFVKRFDLAPAKIDRASSYLSDIPCGRAFGTLWAKLDDILKEYLR